MRRSLSGVKRLVRLGVAAATLTTSLLVLAPATDAAASTARNGHCERGEFCYYWGADRYGSLSDFSGSLANYGSKEPTCYDFKGGGDGRHQCIKNNAVSVYNRSKQTVRVYFNSNYGGPYQSIAPGQITNLNSTLVLNNASHKFM